MSSLTHLDEDGQARMVDVGAKPVQVRTARATALFACQPATIDLLRRDALPKGDVLAVARLAGILAAKKTADLIPLCHPLPLDHVAVDFEVLENGIRITATARTSAKTGVEMEALTAASVAALTLFDMTKAVDDNLHITDLRVIEKTKQ
jgi:cyclic pyranopterin phosphate synthase